VPRYPTWKQSRKAMVAGLGALIVGSACGVSEPFDPREPQVPPATTHIPNQPPAGLDASEPQRPIPVAGPDAGMPPDAAEVLMGDAPGPVYNPDGGVR